MPFVTGRLHTRFPMDDPSRVGEARRHAAGLASLCGLDETLAGRVAIVVTELGGNLVRHATGGMLLLAANPDASEVEIVAVDSGPGMADVDRSLADGFSTSSTPGTGLGAVKRLTQGFDVHSVPGEGTVMVARIRPVAGDAAAGDVVRIAGIQIAAPGETVCGDAWAARVDDQGATILVADGLGHGEHAAEASAAFVTLFSRGESPPPRMLLESGHAALRSTRGAAAAVLRADTTTNAITSCGAGNVLARVISGVTDRTVMTQHGTLGVQIRRPEEARVDWPPHAIVVVHTDGIATRWTTERLMPLLGRDPILIAAVLLRDHLRGRDDATVVVLARNH